jgi:hypothetical protein
MKKMKIIKLLLIRCKINLQPNNIYKWMVKMIFLVKMMIVLIKFIKNSKINKFFLKKSHCQ